MKDNVINAKFDGLQRSKATTILATATFKIIVKQQLNFYE